MDEIVSARKYYGPIGSVGQQHPVRGSVLLINGQPEFHGTAIEVKKFYHDLLERRAKRSHRAKEAAPKMLYTRRNRDGNTSSKDQ